MILATVALGMNAIATVSLTTVTYKQFYKVTVHIELNFFFLFYIISFISYFIFYLYEIEAKAFLMCDRVVLYVYGRLGKILKWPKDDKSLNVIETAVLLNAKEFLHQLLYFYLFISYWNIFYRCIVFSLSIFYYLGK